MNDVFFEIKDGATFIKVRVTTKASKNAVTGIKDGELSISVTAIPENGKANEAIIKLMSKEFKCAKSKFDLVSGSKGRNKLFRVDEVLDFSKFMQSTDSDKTKKKKK